MEQLLGFLNSVYPLSASLADHHDEIIKTKQLNKKELLLKAGHTCRQIYFIEAGLLRCFYIKGDSEVCSWFMKEGDIIVSIESFYRQINDNTFSHSHQVQAALTLFAFISLGIGSFFASIYNFLYMPIPSCITNHN